MVNVLILTNPKDAHSRIVFDCLKKKGASPIRWYPEEYIVNQKSSLTIGKNGDIDITLSSENVIDLMNVHVVWNRRYRLPLLPKKVHSEDYDFVYKENRAHMQSLLMSLNESAIWVNPILSYEFSNSKIVQLREATRLQLTIPNTLISNNKKTIVDFIESNNCQNFKTIYKAFSVPYWAESHRSFCLHTVSVSSEMLPGESIMKLTPGIYQRAIHKSFEVRVTFFGSEHVAVKIHNSKEQDWRILSGSSELKISSFVLPQEIEKKCLQLMDRLKIIFGCFDFIVTPEGEFVFLEVNEMGQFIWIEELLPEIKIIDRFCNFLINLPNNYQINQDTQFSMSEIVNSDSYMETLEDDKVQFSAFQIEMPRKC